MQKKIVLRTESSKCYCCGSNTEYDKHIQPTATCSKHHKYQKPQKLKAESTRHQSSLAVLPRLEDQLVETVRPRISQEPTLLDKQNLILKDIVATNVKYFIDKTKVCCSVKPTNQKLHLPSSTGNTTYNKDFTAKGYSSNDKLQPLDAFRSNYPFFGSTENNANYIQHPVNRNHSKQKQILQENDAPRFLQTMYGKEYKNWGGSAANLKVLPLENNLFKSGTGFNGKSIYNSQFVPKHLSTRFEASCHADNPMFLNMNIDTSSNYKSEFTPKKAELQGSYRHKNVYAPQLSSKDAYNTEYHRMFDPKEHDHCHYRKVMSVAQLQDLITRKA